MSRILTLVVFGLLATTGTASACSLAYQPFEDPTWDGMLRYVDGASLRAKDGSRDVELASGFFISYAARGDRLVVSGQEGLGADCSGDGWLRIEEDGRTLRATNDQARVFDHPEGAILVDGRQATLVPWDGGADRDVTRLPEDRYVLAWSTALQPAYEDRDRFVAGGRAFDLPAGARTAAAAGPTATGVVVVADGTATIHEVPNDVDLPVRTRSWPAADAWPTAIVWAGDWNVIAGGNAYVVLEDVHRVRPTEDPVSLGARGGTLLLFHQSGYLELAGTRALTASQLENGRWVAGSRDVTVERVAASGWTPGEATVVPSDEGPEDSLEAIPFVGTVPLVVALAALAARRRRN